MMKHLDKLENHPIYYTRTQEEFEIIDAKDSTVSNGQKIIGGIYLLKNFKKDLLHLQFITNYSSENDQDKPYVKP